MKEEVQYDNLFYPGILDHDVLVNLFQKINVLHGKYTLNETQNILDQSIESDHQVYLGSKMNIVECNASQIKLSEKCFV